MKIAVDKVYTKPWAVEYFMKGTGQVESTFKVKQNKTSQISKVKSRDKRAGTGSTESAKVSVIKNAS